MPNPLQVPDGYQALVNPSGEVVYSPIGNVQENIANLGYRHPSEQDMHHASLKKEYGDGFGDELTAGLEGAASGATFGLSRHLTNLAGITTPEEQAARKEFNPIASGLGEITGIVAPALLTGGASLTGAVAEGSAKVGTAIGARVTENEIARQIVGKTIGGAIEGLAYGASQPISESALGDSTVTAQKAFSQIGIGALIGGSIGAVTSALGIGGKKLFSKPLVDTATPETIAGTSALMSEGEGVIKPTGPMKMEGTITFDVPDEKILERAAPLNPKNPLKQNDLEWIKANGLPDETGKPTIFSKIGTPEIPTLDPMAADQVYMGDSVKEAMNKVREVGRKFANERDAILQDADLKLSRDAYQGMIKDEIDAVKASGKAGDEVGGKAVSALEKRLELSAQLPEEMDALQIKDRLNDLRNSGKIYTKSGGLKDDFVSETYQNLEKKVDAYLKDNIGDYKKLQGEYAPFVKKSREIEDYLNWDFDKNDSDLVSDWVTNRIAKPFQSSLPGTKSDANLIRWLGELAGTDFEKASKANLIFGKLNPEAAQAGQLGTWGSRVAEGFDILKNPTEIPGKILGGTAKIALSGEAPEFIQTMRTKGIQDILLGKTASANHGIVDSILSKVQSAGKAGSAFLDESGFGSMLTPAAVKLNQFIQKHDNLEHADNQITVLMALEKAKMKTDEAIQSSVDGIFSNKKPTKSPVPSAKMNYKNNSDNLQKITDETNQLINNPEMLIDRLSGSTRGIEAHAPNVAANLSMTATRAIQYLAKKLNTIQPQGEKYALDKKYVPSNDQMSSLRKTMTYINKPYDVLKEIQSGMVSVEGKEVLQNVYPELYQEMKSKVLQGIVDMQAQGKTIPMSKKLGLSFFLGQPLDSTMTQQSIAATQAAFSMPQKGQNAPMPRPSSAKHLEVSGRYMTPLQKVGAR